MESTNETGPQYPANGGAKISGNPVDGVSEVGTVDSSATSSLSIAVVDQASLESGATGKAEGNSLLERLVLLSSSSTLQLEGLGEPSTNDLKPKICTSKSQRRRWNKRMRLEGTMLGSSMGGDPVTVARTKLTPTMASMIQQTGTGKADDSACPGTSFQLGISSPPVAVLDQAAAKTDTAGKTLQEKLFSLSTSSDLKLDDLEVQISHSATQKRRNRRMRALIKNNIVPASSGPQLAAFSLGGQAITAESTKFFPTTVPLMHWTGTREADDVAHPGTSSRSGIRAQLGMQPCFQGQPPSYLENNAMQTWSTPFKPLGYETGVDSMNHTGTGTKGADYAACPMTSFEPGHKVPMGMLPQIQSDSPYIECNIRQAWDAPSQPLGYGKTVDESMKWTGARKADYVPFPGTSSRLGSRAPFEVHPQFQGEPLPYVESNANQACSAPFYLPAYDAPREADFKLGISSHPVAVPDQAAAKRDTPGKNLEEKLFRLSSSTASELDGPPTYSTNDFAARPTTSFWTGLKVPLGMDPWVQGNTPYLEDNANQAWGAPSQLPGYDRTIESMKRTGSREADYAARPMTSFKPGLEAPLVRDPWAQGNTPYLEDNAKQAWGAPPQLPGSDTTSDKSLKLEIICNGYPRVTITDKQAAFLSNKLLEGLDSVPIGQFPIPRFNWSGLVRGVFVVHCADQMSYNWLADIISDQLKGSPFRILERNELKFLMATVFIPGPPLPPPAFLSRLQRQNPELRTERWRVYFSQGGTESSGQDLTLGIDEDSFSALETVEFKPFYGLSRVTFLVTN